MKFLRLILPLFVLIATAGCGKAGAFTAASEDSLLIEAAKEEISISNSTNNKETACSIFVRNVLKRAGYSVPSFMANEFDGIVAQYLPTWTGLAFTAGSTDHGKDALRATLNSYPDHTAFLAQWPRANMSGHVAILEKNGPDEFTIYQAQQGRATPHMKATTVEALLYARNQYGDRTHLRIFVHR